MLWSGPEPAGGFAVGQPLPGASAWTVLGAPGHTDDSIALWNDTTRTLLSGDAVLSARGRVWLTPEIVDADAARDTAARLQRVPAAHLLPGHGRPVHVDPVWAAQRG
jgi:glyoxylase-like metal-dependent hydrolase (beta-lactamase superfamily II)